MAVCVVVLIAVAALCRWHFRTWLAPAAAVAGFWAVGVALPLTLAPDFGYSTGAVAYLTVGVVVFAAGAYLAAPRVEGPVVAPPLPARGARRTGALVALPIVGTAAGLAALAVTLTGGGFSVDSVLSLGGLLRVGNALSVERYEGTGPANLAIPALLTLLYAGALAGPFTALVGVTSRLVRFGPVLAAVLFSLVSTERLVMLTAVALAVGATATATFAAGGRLDRLGLTLAAVAGGVGVLFSGIAFVRVGSVDSSSWSAVTSTLRSYAFGYLAGHSQWFDDYVGLRNGVPQPEPSFFALLDRVRPGTHDVGTSRGYRDERAFGADGGTNIFTMVRSVVMEFGLGRSLAFLAAAGFVTTRWYRAVRRGGCGTWGPWLAVFVATVLLSSTQSLFSFTNTSVGVLAAAAAVAVLLRPGRVQDVPVAPGTGSPPARTRALSAPLPRN